MTARPAHGAAIAIVITLLAIGIPVVAGLLSAAPATPAPAAGASAAAGVNGKCGLADSQPAAIVP